MCHLWLELLEIEETNEAVVVQNMNKPILARTEIHTSRITAVGGGMTSNTSPVVAHVNGLLW